MYCLSIAAQSAEQCLQQMAGAKMVELRGDLCRLATEELAEVVGHHPAVLFTCHLSGVEPGWAEEQYAVAIKAGAKWVDIEIGAPREFQQQIIALAHSAGAKVIISYHNYTLTPPLMELQGVVYNCFALGGDMAKVVTTATDTADCITLAKLYRQLPQEQRARLVAFAMGSEGEPSRRLSLIEGAPFTFVAPDGAPPTAPGQPTLSALKRVMESSPLPTLRVPHKATPSSSKSHFQRAIVAATLAQGESTLYYHGELCGDTSAALGWARSLGAEVAVEPDTIVIKGVGEEGFKRAFPCELFVGESALLARLTLGLIASVGKGGTVVGEATLLGRSFADEIEQLTRLGLTVESNNAHLPITISGQIGGENIVIDGSHSSQFASGILMGAPLLHRATSIEVANPTSSPYLDMTLDTMMLCGIDYRALYDHLTNPTSLVVKFEGIAHYTPQRLFIEGDWSSAGYLLAAAAIAQSGPAPRAEGYVVGGMDICSHQADWLIMTQLGINNSNILEFANPRTVEVEFEGQPDEVEQLYDIVVRPCNGLNPIHCDASDAPDAIPTLAITALFARGESSIGGLGRLVNKESNRRSALITELLALGGDIDIRGNKLIVRGGKPLRAVPLCTYGDHRIAMALAVASIFIEGHCSLDNTECVAKSWPDFWEVMGAQNEI